MKQQGNKRYTYLLAAIIIGLIAASNLTTNRSDVSSSPANYAESNTAIDDLCFRNEELLNEHYQKHGVEMGFSSATEYENAAANVVNNPAALHKLEAEDGDDVYYVESTNEFVIVSTDGYIRTYFYPNDGIAYFNRQ